MDSSDSETEDVPVPLQDMTLCQLVKYSNKSTRHKKEVKFMNPAREVSFNFCLSKVFGIGIRSDGKRTDGQDDGHFVAVELTDEPRKTRGRLIFHQCEFYDRIESIIYHDSKTKGFKLIANYLMGLFPNAPIGYMQIGDDSFEDRKNIINWLNYNGFLIPSLEIRPHADLEVKDLSYILENVKVTDALGIHNWLAKIPDSYRHDLPPFLKHLTCWNSHWIQLNQLVTPYFEFIKLHKTNFTNEDMIWYVEKCLDGETQGLVYFEMDVKDMDVDTIASGVKYKEKKESKVQRLIECDEYTRESIILIGHYDYERDDGMIVTIGHRWTGISHDFMMFVWSKYDVREG